MGVEEVGGPVEGHGGLPGARAALDHQHTAQRGPDDLVLLGLDGGDDVGHPARARPVERGQQCRRPPDGEVAQDELAAVGPLGVGPLAPVLVGAGGTGCPEPLVLDPDDPAALEGQVAPEHQALGIATGGPVEGLGDGGTPVHHQGVVVGAVDGQPADVEGLGVRAGPVGRTRWRCRRLVVPDPVDPPEGQGLVPDVQLLEPGQAGPDDDVPLGP